MAQPLPTFALLPLALALALLLCPVSAAAAAPRPARTPCPAVAACLKRLDAGAQCRVLPVPRRSLIAPVPNATFRLTPLRPGVWAYEDFGFVSLILRARARLVLLDFPDSPGSNKPGGGTFLIDAARRVLDGRTPAAIDMVYSHDHYDHIGAATRFFEYAVAQFPRAKIRVWGTRETRRRIDDSASKRAVPPNVIVGKQGRTLRVGKRLSVRMSIVGGHSGDDLALYIPAAGRHPAILMVVDIVFPRWSPFLNLALTEDVTRYIRVHRDILNFDFGVFIGGHGRIGNKRDVRDNLRFVADLLQAARRALDTVTQQDILDGGFGSIVDPNANEFGNIWFGFIGVVRRLQIDACYRAVIEKWGCRIAGLDFTGRSHCFTAITYLAFQG